MKIAANMWVVVLDGANALFLVNEGNARFFEPAPGRTWLVGVAAAYRF